MLLLGTDNHHAFNLLHSWKYRKGPEWKCDVERKTGMRYAESRKGIFDLLSMIIYDLNNLLVVLKANLPAQFCIDLMRILEAIGWPWAPILTLGPTTTADSRSHLDNAWTTPIVPSQNTIKTGWLKTPISSSSVFWSSTTWDRTSKSVTTTILTALQCFPVLLLCSSPLCSSLLFSSRLSELPSL